MEVGGKKLAAWPSELFTRSVIERVRDGCFPLFTP